MRHAVQWSIQRAATSWKQLGSFRVIYCSGNCLALLWQVRTASFCFARSGYSGQFDQGIALYLPNMSWLQPPGYVHKMIHDTWEPGALTVSRDGSVCHALNREDTLQ